jgi:diguanylate cyclase (GGDEF)-like protein
MSEDMHILLVDPETDLCDVLSAKLGPEGVLCRRAGGVGEVWPLLEKEPIHAIISEMVLPDGPGLDLLKGMAERNLDIPIIYLTGYGGVEWAKTAIRGGAFDYFDKPVDLVKLAAAVRNALRAKADYAGPERRKCTSPTVDQAAPASRDELTGLASHRFVLEQLPILNQECCKKGIPLTLCLIDIDDFRKFNTRQGLSIGDLLLIEVSRRLRRIVRINDIVGRYGGDEFLLVLPGADQKAAQGLAERIKDNFRQEKWTMVREQLDLPFCIGIAEVDWDESSHTLEFLDRALEAVHHAKLQGPGSVVAWNRQLIREISLNVDLTEPDQHAPDYESIKIMMWRFRDLNRKLTNVTAESLRLLVAAVEARDPYTKHHSVRVASYARFMALELGLPDGQVRSIHSAGLLHDIGKIGVPDAILTKPSKLTDPEMGLIRQHPLIAVHILEQARFFAAEVILAKHHHEWFNGKGYPDHLAGQDIPIGARILQIADSTEAMLARRSYKGPYELEKTIRQIREGAGRQFDPALAELAVRLMQDGILEKIWKHAAGADQELNIGTLRT